MEIVAKKAINARTNAFRRRSKKKWLKHTTVTHIDLIMRDMFERMININL